jgi:hypothetical protein
MQEFVTDLAKAQKAFKVAELDSMNPHFRRKYASYEACCKAVIEPLIENGFALPDCRTGITPDGKWVAIGTLRHKSGQYTQSMVPLFMGKEHMQEFGAAVTYARRALLLQLTGAYTGEPDDDGQTLTADSPDKKLLEYEAKAKAAIVDAKSQEEAKKTLDRIKLRVKEKAIPEELYRRVSDEFNRRWVAEVK